MGLLWTLQHDKKINEHPITTRKVDKTLSLQHILFSPRYEHLHLTMTCYNIYTSTIFHRIKTWCNVSHCLLVNTDDAHKGRKQLQGPVVRKPINGNPGLKVNQSSNFSWIKVFSPSMFPWVWHWSKPKLKDKNFKEETSLKSYKIEIKIYAYPGLA